MKREGAQIGVVICNYNKEKEVLDCIQSVLESRFQDIDVYVVDNASTDGSVQAIKQRYGAQVELLVNQENLGGSGGFNAGLRHAYAQGYPYLMCIDNDAMLDEKAIGSLYDFLETHPETGIAASKIYHLESPDYVQQFGQKIDFDYFCTEVNYLNAYEDGTMPEYIYTDSVAACSLMIRRQVIDEIGFMPEDNFLYWDDTEWCYLCNQAGYKVASVGASMALHAMGAKKETVNTFPTYYAWRNWLSFFIKYTPEDRWDKLAETFLSSIFQETYESLHKQEHNRAQTIVLACDDALHGVTGKAGSNRIFALDVNEAPYSRLFAMSQCWHIEEGEHQVMEEYIRSLGKKIRPDIVWSDEPGVGITTIQICDSIFTIEDLSRAKVYIDINDCILASEEDVLDVINYNYSKRAYLYAQKPLFIQKIREMQYQ